MSDITLAKAAEMLKAAEEQYEKLINRNVSGWSAAGKSVQYRDLKEVYENLLRCRALYNSLAGRAAGRTYARAG